MQDFTHLQTPQQNEWVTLTARSSLVDVDALRLRLEMHDITVLVPDDCSVATNFPITFAMGGIRLMVLKQDQRKAHEIMKDWEASLLVSSVSCPSCHSQNAGPVPESGKQKSILYYLLIIFFWPFYLLFSNDETSFECRDCGKKWNERNPAEPQP